MDKKEKLALREQKELARLDREAARPQFAHYLLFVMIVLTVIYIVDEITSNMNAAMQPYVLFVHRRDQHGRAVAGGLEPVPDHFAVL